MLLLHYTSTITPLHYSTNILWYQHTISWCSEAGRWKDLLQRRIGLVTKYTGYSLGHLRSQRMSGSTSWRRALQRKKRSLERLTNFSGLTARRQGMLGLTVRGWLPGWFSEHNRRTVHCQQRLGALTCTSSEKAYMHCQWMIVIYVHCRIERNASSALWSVQKVFLGGVWAVGAH